MASRFILPNADVGSGISPSRGAKLFFSPTGIAFAVQTKDTYPTKADADARTNPNANPVIADATGVFPDIWIEGSYKVVLTDKDNVQQGFGEADPVISTLASDETATIKDTIADAKADDDLLVGGYVRVAKGDALYKIVASGTATEDLFLYHDSVTANLFQLELVIDGGVYKLYLSDDAGSGGDDSTKIQAFFDAIDTVDAIIDTGTLGYLIDEPVTLTSNKRYKWIGEGSFTMGSSFADGSANADLHVMTMQGLAPRTVTTTNLFYNYWKEASVSDVPKGTRILISDNDATRKWDVGGNNYRNSLQAFVDYADDTNGVVNFHPEIDFLVTIANGTTKEIDDTNMIVLIYEDDITVIMDAGIKFIGDLNIITAPSLKRAYSKGLLLKRGTFRINADFSEVSDCIRQEESICFYQGVMRGGESLFGGTGIKSIQGSTTYVDNSEITGYRHGISIAGSVPDGASGFISNTNLISTKQARDASVYPQNESRALDSHGNCKVMRAVNCEIRGVQVGNGINTLESCRIYGQAEPPLHIRQQEPGDNGEFYLDNCDVFLAPDMPSNTDALGLGIGTFESDEFFMADDGFASSAVGWIFEASNTRFHVQHPEDYLTSTVLHMEPGNVDFDRFILKNGCEFNFTGTNIREIAFDPKVNDGIIDLGDTKFFGVGVTVGVRNATIGTLWSVMYVDTVQIFNTDTTAGQSFSQGLQINGDTTVSSNNRKIFIDGAKVESIGTSGIITVNACCSEAITVKNTDVLFTATSGTCTHGIRTDRNQNVITSDHFIAHVDLNTINHGATRTTNSITTAVVINGLNVNGSLPVGFFMSGSNATRGASTGKTTTGTGLTGF